MVLVTGGTGFLGSYIIKQLVEKGYAVRAIRRSKKIPSWIPATIFDKVEWIEGDVLDVVALQECRIDTRSSGVALPGPNRLAVASDHCCPLGPEVALPI